MWNKFCVFKILYDTGTSQLSLPYGLVVRIPGFHPGGPGSIPGVGTFCPDLAYFIRFWLQKMMPGWNNTTKKFSRTGFEPVT